MKSMTIKEAVQSNVPMQVMFYDGDNMCPGIMMGDKIICACCGGVFEVSDVVDRACEDGKNAILMFETWVDLGEEIQGDTSEYCDWEGAVALEMEMEDM
jgi:hypothetical protein